MIICILGIELSSPNKGCCALGYSFLYMLRRITKKMNISEVHYIVVARNTKIYGDISSDFPNLEIVKLQMKNVKFIYNFKKTVNKSDIIFDFSEGDSFSDIYGKKRFIINSILKQIAIDSKNPFIMGPQTYGPFKSELCKRWAKSLIESSYKIFSRDFASTEYIHSLTSANVIETTDIAFSLPYNATNEQHSIVKIGINPSGLLWNGGYTGKNQFGLKVNYQKYIVGIIEKFVYDSRYEIHLISHVSGTDVNNIELDNFACEELKKKFPSIQIAPMFESPIDVKSYISQMDLFIGARMHATIASFSTGVPTIPFSYSRKFMGLYNRFNYEYIINAQELNTEEAIKKTIEFIGERQKVRIKIENSMNYANNMITELEEEIKNLILDVYQKMENANAH